MEAIRGKTAVRELFKTYRREHPPTIEIAFLLQDWTDAYNVGGMFRVADACGARELVLSGRTPTPPNPMIGVTSLGHHRRVPFRTIEHHEDAAIALKREGYHLVAVEIAEGAVCYADYEYPEKLCLILGNEESGVYPKVMRHRDGAVFIPMFGKGRSMNVHVAAAVVAFHAVMATLRR